MAKRAKGTARSAGAAKRQLRQRVKTARGRSSSSTRWLERQLNDPYVALAREQGWRSRAAFKLIEIDDKFRLLKKEARVVDLGAAPGGWTQVAVARGARHVVGIDYLPVDPIPGAVILEMDFTNEAAPAALEEALGGPADLVLSDMAAPTTGHKQTDHLRIVGLAEMAVDFARQILVPGGAFVCKVFMGGTEKSLLDDLKRDFEQVRHVKPKSSRADSSEMYVVATGFRGAGDG